MINQILTQENIEITFKDTLLYHCEFSIIISTTKHQFWIWFHIFKTIVHHKVNFQSCKLTVIMVHHQQGSQLGTLQFASASWPPAARVKQLSLQRNSITEQPSSLLSHSFLTLLVDIPELPPAFTDKVNLLFVSVSIPTKLLACKG